MIIAAYEAAPRTEETIVSKESESKIQVDHGFEDLFQGLQWIPQPIFQESSKEVQTEKVRFTWLHGIVQKNFRKISHIICFLHSAYYIVKKFIQCTSPSRTSLWRYHYYIYIIKYRFSPGKISWICNIFFGKFAARCCITITHASPTISNSISRTTFSNG